MFDYQAIHIIRMPEAQPDLQIPVRLFLETFSKFSGKFINPAAYFRVLLSTNDEIVIGSNHRNFEIRLYFLRHQASSGEIFIIFTRNSLNRMGRLTSIYQRSFLKIIIRRMFKTLSKRHS